MKTRNIVVIFLLSGFWHGANWTFIVWGLLNALFILPSVLHNTNRNHLDSVAHGKVFPSIKELLSIVITFSFTVFAWIFFRADSLGDAVNYVRRIFSRSLFTIPTFEGIAGAILILVMVLFCMIVEWMGREKQFAIQHLNERWSKPMRYAFYYLIVMSLFFLSGKQQEFIYFQF